jgi:membrane protein YqaA with SNARE-associated domain
MRTHFSPKLKAALIILEVCLVVALLILWLGMESIRESKNIWVLLVYAFPSNFLVAVVPFDPAIIFFGRFYAPLYVTSLGMMSVLLVEAINYSVLHFVVDTKLMMKVERSRYVKKIIGLFRKAPFAALCIAGFFPIPLYPFRFLAAMSRYPFPMYLLSVLLSKTPRIFILAMVGYVLNIPDYLIFSFFGALAVIMYISFVVDHLKERRKRRSVPSS